jgi:hypothetical protein
MAKHHTTIFRINQLCVDIFLCSCNSTSNQTEQRGLKMDHDAELEQDEEDSYDRTVGLNEEDLRVHYRAAFETLMPAWNARFNTEWSGLCSDQETFTRQMELAYQQFKEGRQLLIAMDNDSLAAA